MAMRIRKAMCERWHRELLQGVIEMDETYIGGKPRNKGQKLEIRSLGPTRSRH